MSSADQPGSAGVEPGQDFVGLLAQDVRVIERPAEFEEGEIEAIGTAISRTALATSVLIGNLD